MIDTLGLEFLVLTVLSVRVVLSLPLLYCATAIGEKVLVKPLASSIGVAVVKRLSKETIFNKLLFQIPYKLKKMDRIQLYFPKQVKEAYTQEQ